jgi:copper chaperone CopZ
MNRKTLLACAFLAALPSFLSACQSAPRSSPAIVGPSTLTAGNYRLIVHGMSCPKCISNVELQLTRITGVTRPVVDMKNGIVSIEVTDGANPSKDTIANAIADSGFTLVEIRGGTP